MAKRLIPLLDRVLVEKLTAPNKSVGGILLPESATSKVRVSIDDVICLITDILMPSEAAWMQQGSATVDTAGDCAVQRGQGASSWSRQKNFDNRRDYPSCSQGG